MRLIFPLNPPRRPLAPRAHRSGRRRAGFTLNEVLVALGILAIGITAVASLFPAGILMQKRAVKEALYQQNTRSAEALLTAKGIDAQQLFDFTDNIAIMVNSNREPVTGPRQGIGELEFDVFALSEIDIDYVVPTASMPSPPAPDPDMTTPNFGGVNSYDAADSLLQFWPEADRSYPTIEADVAEREFFFVPLFRRGPEATPFINDWVVYLFVMQSQPEIDDPPAGGLKYDNDPTNYNGDSGPITVPANTICANPFDDAAFFPKVFRAEVSRANNNTYDLVGGWQAEQILRLGDLVLGDNGTIYRVGDVNGAGDQVTLNESTRQDIDSITIGDDSLRAIWFVMPPNTTEANPPSPIRDIRVLSRKVVKLEDYVAPSTPPPGP
ncbi:MAG: prepilin-type N-terminal cleavage/methylation domain-containing protein [Planctomycetota bacterium]